MNILFAMALCEWRGDWPPTMSSVHTLLSGLDQQFTNHTLCCRHPPQGPEEYQCTLTGQFTHQECKAIKMELETLDARSLTIGAPDTNVDFSLCRLDVHCQHSGTYGCQTI